MERMSPEETSDVAAMLHAKLLATDAVLEAVIAHLPDPADCAEHIRRRLASLKSQSALLLIGIDAPELSAQVNSAADGWLQRLS